MLSVTLDDSCASDMLEVVHEDVLGEHVDEGLDVGGHLILVFSVDQLAEVAVREGRHEELDVELVSKGICKVGSGLEL